MLVSNKKIIVSEFGGPEVLKLEEDQQLPEPSAGQLRVKVLAAGVGFTDTIIREGQYVDIKSKPPFVLGYDWFGVVDKVGEGVKSVKQGDFVADMPGVGSYCEYLCVNAEQVIPAPEGLDPAEAVSMLLSYATAYQLLTRVCPIPEGKTCVVHAAGGAVGTALLELGRLLGYRMIGTGSASKQSLIESYNADYINYREQDFVSEIKRLTNGKGADIAFDTIGAKNWQRSYKALAKGGRLIGFGALQYTRGEESAPQLIWGFAKLLLLWRLMPDGKHSCFYNVFTRRKKKPEQFRRDVQQLFAWLKESKLKPAIAETMPLEQAAEAHRRVDKGDVEGKLALLNSSD